MTFEYAGENREGTTQEQATGENRKGMGEKQARSFKKHGKTREEAARTGRTSKGQGRNPEGPHK